MLIDAVNDIEVDMRGYSSLPKCDMNVIRHYMAGEVELLVEKNPGTVSGEELVHIPYTVIARYKGKVKAVASVEQTDLRVLSQKLGVSLKELQQEYGARGYLDKGEVYVYGRDLREDYGPYTEADGEEYAAVFLMDIILDVIDSGDDPVSIA